MGVRANLLCYFIPYGYGEKNLNFRKVPRVWGCDDLLDCVHLYGLCLLLCVVEWVGC